MSEPRSPERPSREPEQSWQIVNTRRIIGIAVGAILAVAATIYLRVDRVIENDRRYLKELAKTAAKFDDMASQPKIPETLPRDSFVPEDERTGENILIGATPRYQISEAEGGYDLPETFDNVLDPIISELPEGTMIHLIVPEGSKTDILNMAKERHPGKEFKIYETPAARSGLEFIRNHVLATGKKDKNGKFLIVGSALDGEKYKMVVERNRLQDDLKKTSAGMPIFVDEIIEDKYPENFDLTMVHPLCNNGDMQITKLPNGKTGLIIGKSTFFENMVLLFKERVLSAQMSIEQLAESILLIKKLYRRGLSVDEVILVDEGQIEQIARDKNMIGGKDLHEKTFFDIDMVVKTVTAPNGKMTALCTEPNYQLDYEAQEYLKRVRKQFEELGFDIVTLPCGHYGSMNYVNSIILDRKTAYVPQYGIHQDLEAVQAYRELGYEVVTVDMSRIHTLPEDIQKRTGSLHCQIVALN